MSIKHVLSVVAAGTLALAQGAATAHEVVFSAPMLGASETPPAATPGLGLAKVTIDLDLFTMRVEASFSGLLGNVSAAHIHCCTAVAGTGNAGVASQTPSFIGFPTGGTAGSYDHTFDMSVAGSYNAAFITGNGGTVGSAFNALVAGLNGGKAYLNIHTTSFPGGEIRGLLAPVPEPASIALTVAGLGVVGAVAGRRRRAIKRA